jgi:hypothetical protein
MKTILAFLNFYLLFNFISALETFNSHLQELANQQHGHLNNPNIVDHENEVNETNPLNPSHIQERLYEQQPHSHNDAIAHLEPNGINNESDRLNQQNHPHLQRRIYHIQTTAAVRQQDYPVNNRAIIHPKFRPLLPNWENNEPQSPLEPNIQQNRPFLADERAIVNPTKSSGLLQILTAKAIDNGVQTRRRVSFGDYYYQQKIRSIFGHYHYTAAVPPARPYIRTGLRR